MKTILTIEESEHLIRLGINAKKAHEFVWNEPCNKFSKCFRLQDILSIVPKEIEDNGATEVLNIIMDNDSVYVGYPYIHEARRVCIKAPELIDALNQLLIWCLTEKKINFNTDKK